MGGESHANLGLPQFRAPVRARRSSDRSQLPPLGPVTRWKFHPRRLHFGLARHMPLTKFCLVANHVQACLTKPRCQVLYRNTLLTQRVGNRLWAARKR